jgi:FtsP/CotA-like multicopper oxidase with cupredoxin domain
MRRKCFISLIFLLFLAMGTGSEAAVVVQCPGDLNQDAQWTGTEVQPPNVACKHIVGGDGFVSMADGYLQYIFSFSDVTGLLPDQVLGTAELNAQEPAPQIKVKQGQDFYLTLTTAPMRMRPDLFDAHSVHWHGFPNAAPVFDGEPMASIGIFPGASFTFYYKVPSDPGSYGYHCHVEATEHMQMGMLAHIYVTPLQDGTSLGTCFGGSPCTKFAYNDGDGSTGYDVDVPLLIIGFDPAFHDANQNVQPLPFADMVDRYMMINGRGYPDTVNPGNLPAPVSPADDPELIPLPGGVGKVSQQVNSLITATQGQRVLLRIINFSTVHFSTITIPGITMKVVGKDAKILRGADGQNLYYETNTLTLGGGQSAEVLLDTTNVAPGTYFLYTTKHHDLSNNKQDFGGLMTEIVIQ